MVLILMKSRFFTIFALVLFFGTKAFSQEWEYSMDLVNDHIYFRDIFEMPDGTIVMSTTARYPNNSRYPSLFLFSQDGELLGRKDFFKPAFWGDESYVITDDLGAIHLISAYSPDHDTTSFNYFLNYDNPPDYAAIVLYDLDENFDIIDSHETKFPIDTAGTPHGDCNINSASGSILLVDAQKDGDAIVGAYVKQPTFDYFNPRGYDSIFFFRMDFDGNFIQRVGYETESEGGLYDAVWLYNQFFKTDNGFVFCYNDCPPIHYTSEQGRSEQTGCPGRAYIMDNDFHIQDMKYFHVKVGTDDYFYTMSVAASDHNTFYASYNYHKNSTYHGCCIYEYGLDDGGTGTLPIIHYITRKSPGSTFDKSALLNGIVIAEDNTLYYTYSLSVHKNCLFIEHLTPGMDSIRTLVYENEEWVVSPHAYSIRLTDDGSVFVVFRSWRRTPNNTSQTITHVIKFPTEAFMSIDEAHQYGLKTAVAYPNPGSSILNIQTSLQNARAEVYNINGRLMHSQDLTESITSIDTETWPNGLYVWKVFVNNKEAETGKWAKE